MANDTIFWIVTTDSGNGYGVPGQDIAEAMYNNIIGTDTVGGYDMEAIDSIEFQVMFKDGTADRKRSMVGLYLKPVMITHARGR